MLRAAGQLDEALRVAREATQLNPRGGEQWYAQGEVERELLRLDEALASAEKAIQYSPQLARGYVLQGLIFTLMNRHGESIKPFRKALRLAPSADLYADLGTVYSVLADMKCTRFDTLSTSGLSKAFFVVPLSTYCQCT